jgi:hypothetical protein
MVHQDTKDKTNMLSIRSVVFKTLKKMRDIALPFVRALVKSALVRNLTDFRQNLRLEDIMRSAATIGSQYLERDIIFGIYTIG